MQGLLFPYSCAASHSAFSHYWGFQNHSCSNSGLPTWFLQLSPGWHISFKSDSPSACPEYSCSGGRTKTSVLPHHTCSLWFCIGFRFATELALKLLRLLSECYNFSSHLILLLSPHNMYRCEHSALLHLCQYVFPHVKPPWQPPNHFHLLLRVSGMHCQIICRPSQLFRLLEELSNITYSCLLTLKVVQNLVWSNQLNVSHFVIQCPLLPSHSPEIPCRPSKGVPSERLRLVKRFISHRLHTGAWVNLVLLTYLFNDSFAFLNFATNVFVVSLSRQAIFSLPLPNAYGGRNSTTAEKVSKFQHLSPNPQLVDD